MLHILCCTNGQAEQSPSGGARGIGLATAVKLLNEGVAGLAVIDLNEDLLVEAEKVLRPLAGDAKLIFVRADVANEADTKNYIEQALLAFDGRLDVSIQNAGISASMREWHSTPISEFDKQVDVNTKGVWLGIKHSAGAMLKTPAQRSPNLAAASYPPSKAIVLLSSVAGLYGQQQVSLFFFWV